jgi:hypothetical protein
VTRTRLVVAIAAAAATAAAFMISTRHGDDAIATADAGLASASTTSARHFSFAWPAGKIYAYAFTWSNKEEVDVTAAAGAAPLHATGVLDIDARLELRSWGLHDGRFLLGARLSDLKKHVFVVNDTAALPDAAAVASLVAERQAVVECAPDGKVRALWFAKDAPPVFRHLMKSLVTELEVAVPAAAILGHGWTVDQETPLGLAQVRYAATGGELIAGVTELTRVRGRYGRLTGFAGSPSSVTSKGRVGLAIEGHVQSIEQHDEVLGDGDGGPKLTARTDLRSVLAGIATFDASTPPDLSGLDRATPGVIDASAGAERALLDQQAAGLTLSELLSSIALAPQGDVPSKSRFLWRATGLLARDPEACDELARMFRAAGTTSKQKALILDLLAGAGTPRAQAAMRHALGSDTAKKDPDYPVLVQRFSFLRRPDRASGDFVDGAYREASAGRDSDARYATAYSLGAVADNLRKGGEAAAADGYARELRRDLGKASTPEERANLVTALGSANRPEDVTTIAAASTDPNAAVRRAAAIALHGDTSAEGLAALLRLVGDPAPSVQQAALRSLSVRALSLAALDTLATLVERGVLSKTSYGDLLALLASRTAAGGPIVRMLAFVISHSDDDPSMATRAKRLLIETGVGGP